MTKQDIINRIQSELQKIALDENYTNDEAENAIFEDVYNLTGWHTDINDDASEYFLKATNSERLKYVLKYLVGSTGITGEAEILAQIEMKIKESCVASNYVSLCNRIQTPAGLAYAVNRCVKMMAKDKLHFSAALAQLEAEEEGIN